jgi:hypothetical protein
MSHDLVHNIKALQAREADGEGAAVSATFTGQAIDCALAVSICFLVDVGLNAGNAFSGTHSLTFKVQEGDLSDSSDMADIAAIDYLGGYREDGSAWDYVLDAATDDSFVYRIGVRTNTKRYKRVIGTEAGTVSAVPVGVIALLDHVFHAPV